MENKNTFTKVLKSWIINLCITIGIKLTIVEAYIIPTGSMEKTIMAGDFILEKNLNLASVLHHG